MREVFTIYQFVLKPTGEVLYVGCTSAMEQRMVQHKSSDQSTFRPIWKWISVEVIRTAKDRSSAYRIELQIQTAYKRRGMCIFNFAPGKTMAYSPLAKRAWKFLPYPRNVEHRRYTIRLHTERIMQLS